MSPRQARNKGGRCATSPLLSESIYQSSGERSAGNAGGPEDAAPVRHAAIATSSAPPPPPPGQEQMSLKEITAASKKIIAVAHAASIRLLVCEPVGMAFPFHSSHQECMYSFLMESTNLVLILGLGLGEQGAS